MAANLVTSLAQLLPPSTFARVVANQYHLFEPELGRAGELVPPGRRAVDVGMWWGPWTRRLARLATAVDAFEPNPDLVSTLSRTLPPNVTVHPFAVSDRSGEATLRIPVGGRGSEGRATLLPPGAGAEAGSHRSVPVSTVALDDLNLGDVGFVKVDVEGRILEALRGADRLIRRNRPNLVLEIEEQFHPEGVGKVFEHLSDLDYRGRYLLRGHWHPVESFDPWAHQTRYLDDVMRSGFTRNLLVNARRYINNFVFEPA